MTLDALAVALLVKPALVLATAVGVTYCLRRRSAAARHTVWAGAIVATLALPLVAAMLPPLRVPGLATRIDWSSAGVASRGAISSTGPSAQVVGEAPRTSDSLAARAALDGVGVAHGLTDAIVACWMIVAVLLVVRRVIAEARVHRIVRQAHRASARLDSLGADLARASGNDAPMEIRLSDAVASPAVVGILRPVVLLPASADEWSDEELRAVLVHELGHVARHDCLLNFIADIAAALYWCNPLSWMAVSRLRTESERACDDIALRGGAEPDAYASLLLAFARATGATHPLPRGAPAMARASELESRLLAVLDANAARAPVSRWRTVAYAGVGIVVAVPAAALTVRAAPRAVRAVPPAVQVAPLPDTQPVAPEPDRLGDSLSAPSSERLPLPPGAYRVSADAARALAGPDSILVSQLIAAVQRTPSHGADLTRERAAWALGRARDGRLVEPLLEALGATDWRVRSYAAWALATAREPRAVPHLVPLLRHPIWRLRAMAAYALRESRDRRARDAMSSALADPAWQVRVEAVEYFAAVREPGLEVMLRPRLNDRHVAVRLAAARALNLP